MRKREVAAETNDRAGGHPRFVKKCNFRLRNHLFHQSEEPVVDKMIESVDFGSISRISHTPKPWHATIQQFALPCKVGVPHPFGQKSDKWHRISEMLTDIVRMRRATQVAEIIVKIESFAVTSRPEHINRIF